MKKTNRLLVFILALCMVFTGAMLLVGCGDKNDNPPATPDKSDAAALQAAAGTYTNTWYESTYRGGFQKSYTLELTTAKKWNVTYRELSGLKEKVVATSGTFEINANKELTEFHFDNIAETEPKNKVMGAELPSEEEEYDDDDVIQREWMYQNYVSIQDGYIVVDGYLLDNYDGIKFYLYKAGTTKFSGVRNVTTPKDYYGKYMTYETDFYFVKDSYDFEDDYDKENFLNEIKLEGETFDKFGNRVSRGDIDATGFTGITLDTTGKRSGTVTYESNGQNVSKNITYTVVEEELDCPEYANVTNLEEGLYSVYVDPLYPDEPEYSPLVAGVAIEKGTEFYAANLALKWASYRYHYAQNYYVEINSTNATGANAVVTFAGYNKDTVGGQLVTITYEGKSIVVPVFVYDNDTNPVITVVANGGYVKITEATDGSRTIDYTHATAQEYKANGDEGAVVTFTAADALDLRALSTYDGGYNDSILFKHDITVNGTTYTFYIIVNVQVEYAGSSPSIPSPPSLD